MLFDNIKLIVSDLDGTLLNDQSELTPQVIQAVQKILPTHQFTIATGRPWPAIQQYLELLQLNTQTQWYYICENGACIMDGLSGKAVYESKQAFPYWQDLLNWFDKENLGLRCSIDGQSYVDKRALKTEYGYQIYTNKIILEETLTEFIQTNESLISQYSFIDKPSKIKAIYAYLSEFFPQYGYTISLPWILDITIAHQNKKQALEYLLKNKYHISPQQVLAIGDGNNDIDMLMYAGIGIAMQNACEALSSKVTYQLHKSNQESGIADLLNNGWEAVSIKKNSI